MKYYIEISTHTRARPRRAVERLSVKTRSEEYEER